MNATNHSSLYKQDMRPVYRNKASGIRWQRIKNAVKFTKGGDSERSAYLNFEHVIDADDDTTYFAFTYPYTYEMVQKDLEDLKSHVNDLSTPGSLFYQREILTKTPEVMITLIYNIHNHIDTHLFLACFIQGRNVDLITISSSDNAGDKIEPALSGLFPDYPMTYNQRPPAFLAKEVFFVSARVHPGEVN